MKELYNNAATVASWMATPAGRLYQRYLEDQMLASLKELRAATDLVTMGRAQGKFELAKTLVELKNDLDKYLGKQKEEKN